MSELLQCYNKGCLQKFNPSENDEKSCTYHPGQPIFHDVYKSWSCCKKKTTDFTVFLSTKGCTVGRHNSKKPVEVPKPVDAKGNGETEKVVVVNAPKPPQSAPRVSENHPMKKLPISIAPSLKAQLMKAGNSDNVASADSVDITTEIAIGTQCRRPACTKTFEKNLSPDDACWYHSGVAIFHEGMKYWSCCQRKTSDFDSFLQQAGCTSGKHRWIKDDDEKTAVSNCRHDWHQTGSDLYVTIYSKLPQPADSFVECNEVNLKAHIVFEDGKSVFNLEIPLWGAIEIANSMTTMSASKVEIKMKKREPVSWPSLVFRPRQT